MRSRKHFFLACFLPFPRRQRGTNQRAKEERRLQIGEAFQLKKLEKTKSPTRTSRFQKSQRISSGRKSLKLQIAKQLRTVIKIYALAFWRQMSPLECPILGWNQKEESKGERKKLGPKARDLFSGVFTLTGFQTCNSSCCRCRICNSFVSHSGWKIFTK